VTRTINVEQTTARTAAKEDTTEALVAEVGALAAAERVAFLSHCHARAMSMGHVFLMSKLQKHGPLPMTRVADLLGSGLPTATGFVSRLEERGLVRRDHDTRDRRVVLVSLTEAGLADVDALNQARERRMKAAIAQLSTREQTVLLTALRSLRSALERINEGT
jgi:MarR family transcriptional regulator, organic hydroperoxide resistance regulator